MLTVPDEITVFMRPQDQRPSWASLSLRLQERAAKASLLTHAPTFQWCIQPLDHLSANYTLENWESGVLSGVGFAFRALRRPYQGVVLNEMKGCLAGGDIGVLAMAASVGVAGLLGLDHAFVQTSGWGVSIQPGTKLPPP